MNMVERLSTIKRSLEGAMYIVNKGATLKETAEVFGVTEERVFTDITIYLNKETELYKSVKAVLSTDEYYMERIKPVNRMPISVKSREIGMYMVSENASLEDAAKTFGISKEAAYDHITQDLNPDSLLYQLVMEIVKKGNSKQKEKTK